MLMIGTPGFGIAAGSPAKSDFLRFSPMFSGTIKDFALSRCGVLAPDPGSVSFLDSRLLRECGDEFLRLSFVGLGGGGGGGAGALAPGTVRRLLCDSVLCGNLSRKARGI